MCHARIWIDKLTVVALLFLLSACAPAGAPTAAPAAEAEAPAAEAAAPAGVAAEVAAEADAGVPPPRAAAASARSYPAPLAGAYNLDDENAVAQQPASANRKIIKNGELQLQVADTDLAVDRVTQIASDAGGYIVSSRTWFQDTGETSHKYATITMGVPADQFEPVLRQLRAVAVRVLNETASGEDVTDQYVDLQSQLENLKATRDRVRTFLDRAQTVEEALKVNEDLAEIEADIANVQGRINYLAGRSSFSTIVANLEPEIPPTPTPTPAPTPTPVSWNPGATAVQASETLRSIFQGLVDALIWVVIVILPMLLPILLIVWLVWRFGFGRAVKKE